MRGLGQDAQFFHMSRTKAKQIANLARVPQPERYEHVDYPSPLHAAAFGFKMAVHNGLQLKANPKLVPRRDRKWVKHHYDQAIEMFRRRFLDAYHRQNGGFFRALADVFEPGNPIFSQWSPLEKMICTDCSIASERGEPLPSAGQLLRAWKIKCGIVPDRKDDLEFLWAGLVGGPMPSSRAAIERSLRPSLGEPRSKAADVQIKQIQQAAKNLGFTLPKQATRNCLPAGCEVVPD